MNPHLQTISAFQELVKQSDRFNDPLIEDISNNIRSNRKWIKTTLESLTSTHSEAYCPILPKSQESPAVIIIDKKRKRPDDTNGNSKMTKFDMDACENFFGEIVQYSYNMPGRYNEDVFMNRLAEDTEDLAESLKKIYTDKNRPPISEGSSIWKKVLYRGREYSHSMRELIEWKIKNAKKFAKQCKSAVDQRDKRVHEASKDSHKRAEKLSKEMLQFWKKSDKDATLIRKKEEKEEMDRRKKEEELLEAQRQQKKLNFLLTQTELYSHFMSKKNVDVQKIEDTENDPLSESNALATAKQAAEEQLAKIRQFDNEVDGIKTEKTPTSVEEEKKFEDPKIFKGTLKKYQVEGLNWLISLYDQGINGILADEMGLGKTIQCIGFLGHLAEEKDVWGPYLVITPTSTLHNWVAEFEKFCPTLSVMPYWGNVKDRQILRKSWEPKKLHHRDSSFHVLISSYGILLEDEKYFQKIKWQYLVLDEAHSIKSVKTQRWQTLISLNVRNRLLLTGSPLQNNMGELFALLHFIMPSLFDSHEDFNEWFSKGIEANAKKTAGEPKSLNEQQIQRLHLILKPFMLRRVKNDVLTEIGPKDEKTVLCDLSFRQNHLYKLVRDAFKNRDSDSEANLSNYVMEFRKICNHPNLFEEQDVEAPYSFYEPNIGQRKGDICVSAKNPIELVIPKVIYREVLEEQHPAIFDIFQAKNMKGNETFSFVSQMKRSIGDVEWLSHANLYELCLFYQENQHSSILQDPEVSMILTTRLSRALASPIRLECSDRSFAYHSHDALENGWIKNVLHGFSTDSPQPYITLSQISNKIIPNSENFENCMRISPVNFIKIPSVEDWIASSGKLLALDNLLKDLFASQAKVLVFSQMTKMMDILEDLLNYRGYKYLRLDGSTALQDRNERVTLFQSRPDIFIFLLSTRAGGLGINLTAANTVIFYDLDWNPTSDSQAMDRCHRIGQTRPVTVYRLITRNTVDERILEVAHQKSIIQDTVYKGSAVTPSTKELMLTLLE